MIDLFSHYHSFSLNKPLLQYVTLTLTTSSKVVFYSFKVVLKATIKLILLFVFILNKNNDKPNRKRENF